MSFAYTHQSEHDVVVQLSHFFLNVRRNKIRGYTISKSLKYIISMIRDNVNAPIETLRSCGIVLRSDCEISIAPVKLRGVFYLHKFSKCAISSGWVQCNRRARWFTYKIPTSDPLLKTLSESRQLYVENDDDQNESTNASNIANLLIANFTRNSPKG